MLYFSFRGYFFAVNCNVGQKILSLRKLKSIFMKSIFILVAVALSQFAVAQQTVTLKEFKSLTVGSDTEVTMIKSNKNELVVKDSDEETADISNEEGLLVLNSDGNYVLYYNCEIENITVASDGILVCNDEIKSDKLSVTADSDAVVTLKVNVMQLQTTANSDAVITLKGKAVNHSAAFNSDAELNAKDLVNDNTDITLASDATAVITSKKSVNATASSDASLTIYGKPKDVNKKVSDDAEIIMK